MTIDATALSTDALNIVGTTAAPLPTTSLISVDLPDRGDHLQCRGGGLLLPTLGYARRHLGATRFVLRGRFRGRDKRPGTHGPAHYAEHHCPVDRRRTRCFTAT